MKSNGIASKSGLQDVKSRILFLLFVIFIFRLGSHVPVPGLDYYKLAESFSSAKEGLFGFLNVISGGSLARMSVFTLSLSPYISASIAIQMLSYVLPNLEQLRKEGGRGKHKLTRYTRILALLVALVQSIPMTRYMVNNGLVIDPSPFFFINTSITLATGTLFLVWLGEQITERGIGNGISMIICAGIASRLPEGASQLFEMARTGEMNMMVFLFVCAVIVSVTIGVIMFEKAQRQIKITHPSRHQVRSAPQHSIPLKLNMAGVLPPIFATTLVFMPLSILNMVAGSNQNNWVQPLMRLMSPGQPMYIAAMVAAIAFFSFFYTSLMVNPTEIANGLKKNGVIVPGIRPGGQTATFIDNVLKRITLFGILYLSFVVLLPEIFVRVWQIPFYFGGTSLLIIVVVVMDFMSQLTAHLMPDKYTSLLEKPGKSGNKQNLQLFR